MKAHSKQLDPVIAVHEAGHAVARYLTAEDFGIDVKAAITHIEIAGGTHLGASADGEMQFISQATTYGPQLTRELQEVFHRETVNVPREALIERHVVDAIKVAQTEGADVEKWLRGRMLIAVFASVAEAKYTGRPVDVVLHSYESEDDLRSAIKEGLWAGLDIDAIQIRLDEAVATAMSLIQRKDIQRAIKSLADALPARGRMSGTKAVRIIRISMQGRANRV